MTTPIVSMQGITKRFPGVVALDGVNLELNSGEVVGLVGKNGAGKSSTIKILAGAERPNEGEVRIDGAPLSDDYNPRVATELGLAFVHQEFANFLELSVAENVALGMRYPHRNLLVDFAELRDRVSLVLDQLRADIDPSAIVADLSSVERRVVMIARALYHEARVLVLDEPSVSLSFREIEHLHAVVRRVREQGRAVVYASHQLQEILDLTDRVVVMQDGRVTLTAPTRELEEANLVSAIAGGVERTGRAWLPAENERARTAAASEPVLKVSGLTRSPKVEDVNFELRAGEILGLAGLVGSGRTETVRIIFGADHADTGTVEINGTVVNPRSPLEAFEAGIALLPEDRRGDGLILDFSVRKNVTLASLTAHRVRKLLPFPRKRSEDAVTSQMIERLSIATPDGAQEVGRLSGGNQQKVVLAKLLQRSERVLIFDEPTQGVDVGAKEEIFLLIRELAAEGRSVIVISSDFSELVGLCDRVVVLREGRVAGEVAGDEVNEKAMVSLAFATQDKGLNHANAH